MRRRLSSSLPANHARASGFSLAEALIVVAMLGTLAGMTVPRIVDSFERGKIDTAVADIAGMTVRVETFREQNGRYPDSLAEVGLENRLDPYGNPYEYLRIEGGGDKIKPRKDRFLVPLNADYDLYSMGLNEVTNAPLTSEAGSDDVLRANDGAFVGLASKY